MSTNTGGPAGPGPGGGSGTGPKLVAGYHRAMSHLDAVYDGVIGRLGNAIYRSDRVAQADANTSVADLRAAVQLAAGNTPEQLDRNGWLR